MSDAASVQTESVPQERGQIIPWIVLVGGFLGAGKTTLLLAAARELERRGMRSAIIFNDQSERLVDTQYAAHSGTPSEEVTGGCFCCRFSDLMQTMERLRAHAPDVIFAEPVGSCTDISATILHPLRDYGDRYRLAPFTVLVDPQNAEALLGGEADRNLSFLFRKQLEEADLVCFTKADISPDVPRIAARNVRQIGAKTGLGVAAWLDEVLSGTVSAGSQLLDIDYEQYAQAEAALAWLNLQVAIRPRIPASPAFILGRLLDSLDSDLTASGISIVHLKAILNSDSGFLKAAICANGAEPAVEGDLDASPARNHRLLLNLRCLGESGQVQSIVEDCLARTGSELTELNIRCFHPAPPTPERRVLR
jgi:Ni2+-binding GTPase involved in maturation of urease and hydrogenase